MSYDIYIGEATVERLEDTNYARIVVPEVRLDHAPDFGPEDFGWRRR